jgi:DNA-binding NarL/FixJ family response regulator
VKARRQTKVVIDSVGADTTTPMALDRLDTPREVAEAHVASLPEVLSRSRETGSEPPRPASTAREPASCVERIAARTGLTRRETDVLKALADGLTNRGIALSLGVSPRTVESHLEGVYDKLGVSSRAAALSRLFDVM